MTTVLSFLAFTGFVAGYAFTYRMRLADEGVDNKKAGREFMTMTLVITVIILLSFYYSYLLDHP